MLRNAPALLGCFWLLLAPALCAAGVLRHACDCSSGVDSPGLGFAALDSSALGSSALGSSGLNECEPCCGDEELGCDCVEDGCSHDSCANDPCQMGMAVARDRGSHLDPAGTPLLDAAAPAVSAFLERGSALLDDRPTGNTRSPGPRKNVPYHRSDIPLLV